MRVRLALFVVLVFCVRGLAAAPAPAADLTPEKIAAAYGKSVVLLVGGTARGETVLGTGFFVSTDGKLVTNLHVVRGVVSAGVRLKDGRIFKDLRVIAYDLDRDLAVLQVVTPPGSGGRKTPLLFPSVRLGDSGAVHVGARIVVIGNPEGLTSTVSDGLVSAIRDVAPGNRRIQISAPISPGSSGSPVFDRTGQVIGVAQATLTSGQSLGFAVPIHYVRGMLAGELRLSLRELATKLGPEPAAANTPPAPRSDRLLLGHRRSVLMVGWSPDGKRLFTAGQDRSIRAWNPETGELQWAGVASGGGELDVDPTSFFRSFHLAVSPNGRRLAVANGEVVRILNGETGREEATIRVAPHDAAPESRGAGIVWALCWSPDGNVLVGVAPDGLRWWDVATGAEFRFTANQRKYGPPVSAAWSPDGARLVLTGDIWHVCVVDVATGSYAVDGAAKALSEIDLAACAAWSPDGHRLALGIFKRLEVWDSVTGVRRKHMDGHGDAITSVSWSPDGAWIASGSKDGTVRIWNVETAKEQAVLYGHPNHVLAVGWSPNGTQLASGGRVDGTVHLWDVRDPATRLSTPEPTDAGHADEITDVAWSSNGQWLASTGGKDRTVRVWNPDTGACRAVLRGHTSEVVSAAWSPDGQRLASGSSDGYARIWDPWGKRCRAICREPVDDDALAMNVLAWKRDGNSLLAGARYQRLGVWDSSTGKKRDMLSDYAVAVAYSPSDGTLAVVASHRKGPDDLGDGKADLLLRDPAGGLIRTLLADLTNPPTQVRWSPDGKLIAVSGQGPGPLRVIEAATGRVVFSREDLGWDAVWSPDSKRLAVLGVEIGIYQVPGGDCLRTIHPDARVNSLAWRPGSDLLALGDEDAGIELWDAGTGTRMRVIR